MSRLDLNTVTESLLMTVFGSEFQTAAAERASVSTFRKSGRRGRLLERNSMEFEHDDCRPTAGRAVHSIMGQFK